jgi:16S rRNA (cytosine1402-N4)-methyltransferase
MQAHTTVLLEESVAALNLKPRSVAVDATVGQGGHALLMAAAVGPQGTVLALDADTTSLARAESVLTGADTHLVFVHGNFRHIKDHAVRAGITSADGILFDLGWHSGQLQSGRGFSFNEDAPLVMTLNPDAAAYTTTAADIIATWSEGDLANLFKTLGGERFSGRIARVIVETREKTKIETSKQLAEVIVSAVPRKFQKGRIHPATRVFQALRMQVNDELGALRDGLDSAYELLAPEGRLAVISFHSLEDKVVKEWMRERGKSEQGTILTKKPAVPSRLEQKSNPRSRSAKLRIFQKL